MEIKNTRKTQVPVNMEATLWWILFPPAETSLVYFLAVVFEGSSVAGEFTQLCVKCQLVLNEWAVGHTGRGFHSTCL